MIRSVVVNVALVCTTKNATEKDTQSQAGRAPQHCLEALNEVCESSPLHLHTCPFSCSTSLVKKKKFPKKLDIWRYIKISFWSIQIQFLNNLI